MFVSEIWDDAKSSMALGTCEPALVYRGITDAVRMLANKVREWDWMVGAMDICAPEGYITLPREVATPIAVSVNGLGSWPRDKYFVHHINGPGAYSGIDGTTEFHDEVGDFPTFRNVCTQSILLFAPEIGTDNGKEVMVYGYDWMDAELQHTAIDGKRVLGIRVPITTDVIPLYPDLRVVQKITGIAKPVTDGPIRLWSFNPNDYTEAPTLLSYYYADETRPSYKRIRVMTGGCVTMKYRRRNLEFTSQSDFIPIDNRIALILAMSAVRRYATGELQAAMAFEEQATRLLKEEESAKKFIGSTGPQVRDTSVCNTRRLWSSSRCGYC